MGGFVKRIASPLDPERGEKRLFTLHAGRLGMADGAFLEVQDGPVLVALHDEHAAQTIGGHQLQHVRKHLSLDDATERGSDLLVDLGHRYPRHTRRKAAFQLRDAQLQILDPGQGALAWRAALAVCAGLRELAQLSDLLELLLAEGKAARRLSRRSPSGGGTLSAAAAPAILAGWRIAWR